MRSLVSIKQQSPGGPVTLWPSGVIFCYGLLVWPSGKAFWYWGSLLTDPFNQKAITEGHTRIAFWYGLLVRPSGVIFCYGLLVSPPSRRLLLRMVRILLECNLVCIYFWATNTSVSVSRSGLQFFFNFFT